MLYLIIVGKEVCNSLSLQLHKHSVFSVVWQIYPGLNVWMITDLVFHRLTD